MKSFLRSHSEAVLIACALFFLAMIVGFYWWGVGNVVTAVNASLNYTPSQQSAGFDLPAAGKLDLRGLVK